MNPLSQISNKKMYHLLLLLTIASVVGFEAWRNLYNNFAVEVVHLNGFQNGLIQGVREIPGLLAVFIIVLLLFFREYRLCIGSVFLLGLGVAFTGFTPNFSGLMMATVVLSIGFHIFETINQSLILQNFNTKEAPLVISKLRGINAGTNLVVAFVVFSLSFILKMQWIFFIFGSAVIMAALFALRIKPGESHTTPQRKGLVVKKKYSLYYALTFLAGARRHILMTFAIFLLVEKFSFSLQQITGLFVITNIINYFVNPLIGKAINAFGERTLLRIEYGSVIVIFLVYAFSKNPWVVAVFYILDYVLINFGIAIRTYFQKIAAPEDIAPSMALGFTINHIAAVFIPLMGGALWVFDYRIPFVTGAILGVLSLLLIQKITLN